MIIIHLNAFTAKAVRDYEYEPNEEHLLKLDNCLQLMDFTVCIHEITGGGPPYWFAPSNGTVQSATTYKEGTDIIHIDLSVFSPEDRTALMEA